MMRKLVTLLLLAFSVSWASAQESGNDEVLINLWEGEQEFVDWSANVTLDADAFSSATVGDEIVITVSEISTEVTQWPQAVLNDRGNVWQQFEDAPACQLASMTAPAQARFAITEAMLASLKENGVAVKGLGCTITAIDLAKKIQLTVDVTLNLWKGEQVCTDDWQGYVILDAPSFGNAEVGNEIIVAVSAISATAQWPQVMLNDRSWTTLVDTEAYMLTGEAPTEARFTITEAMLAEIQANGMVVKGAGFTMTSIDLFKKVDTGDGGEKGDAVETLWTGEEPISWSADNSNHVKVAASAFTNAQVGFKLRMNFTYLQKGAQGRIINGSWSEMPDAEGSVSPLSGSYYEFEITEAMLTELQSNGMIVSGIGYTLTSVELIDPSKMYNIVLEFERDDIRAWEHGETPVLHVMLTSLEAQEVTTTIKVSLMTDAYEYFNEYTQEVTLQPGEKQTIAMEMELTPGFYRMTANANYTDICSYVIGYDPTSIVSPDDSEPDFWTYWDNALNELKGINPEFTFVQKMDAYCTENRDVWMISMKSVSDKRGGQPVTIRAYYAEPTKPGTYPTIVHYQGTDGGTSTPWCMGGDDNKDWCELILSTRGQMLNNRPPYEADNIYGSNYYAYEFGDTSSHYYRGAYLDCVRAIDFLVTREKVNAKNIFAAGGSQGGSFVYAAAALDGRLRAIAPSITGHADFVDDVKIVSWPANVFEDCQEALGITDEEMFTFLSYFDVKNFASRIYCPTITNFSLQDTTDPPHVNIAPYNLLTNVDEADKQYIINPFLGHSTPSTWTPTYMEFFERYIDQGHVGVETVDADQGDVNVSRDGMNIVVEGSKKNKIVNVFTMSGVLVASTTDTVIPMEQHGFYLVSVNGSVFKIAI